MTMPAWISELQAFSTPIIAIGAVIIASQQYRIAKRKLRLDLYDKRYQIYSVIQTNIVIALNKSFDQTGDENTRKMNVRVREARFLFSAITFNYINQIETDVLSYRYGTLVNDKSASSQIALDAEVVINLNQTGKRLLESLGLLEKMLHPYLSIDDSLSFSLERRLETKNLSNKN